MKNAIKALLSREDNVGALAVTTAIVRLYARQTNDEQNRGTTVEHNGRGFNAFHAKDGTYMAHYALGAKYGAPKGVVSPEQWDMEVAKLKRGEKTAIRLISGKFLAKARKIALFYVNQLVAEAELKRELQSEREAIMAEDSYPESGPPTLGSPRFPFPTSERPIQVTM